MLLGAATLGAISLGSAAAYGPALPYIDLAASIALSMSISVALDIEQQIPAPGTPTYPPTINLPSNFLIAANNKKTTLAQPLAIDTLVLTLTDAFTWPTSGAVTLDLVSGRSNTSSEIVYFNDRDGNVLTLASRAEGGTTAKAWPIGMSAEMRITAEHHNLLASGIIAVETKLETKADSAATLTGLTGDVTTSGTGESTATISDEAVTFAKFQNIAPSVLLGRGGVEGAGHVEEIVIGTGLSFSGSTLNALAAQEIVIDPTASPYNALGDGVELLDGVSNGSTTFTSASANFTEADIGKRIVIDKVGASGYAPASRFPHSTTIASVTNSHTIILNSNTQAVATGLRFIYGTNDAAAIQSAFDDCPTFGGNAVLFPAGRIFFTTSPLTIQRYALDSESYAGGKYGTIRISGYGAMLIFCGAGNAIDVNPVTIESIYHAPIIEGLTIEGIGFLSQTGIGLSETFDAVIRDVRIRRVSVGVDLRGALQARVQNVMVDYYTQYGIWLRVTADNVMPCNATVIDGARCRAATAGIASYYLLNADQCELRNCISESSSTTISSAVKIEVTSLTDYAHVNRISNLYAEVETYTDAVIRVINNGSTIIEHVRRYPAPGAPFVSATGSAASSIVVRDFIATSSPIGAVNSWIMFTQNAANTVGWIFENMGEFITGESRDLTTAAFWTGGTVPNKVTHIEPGRVTTRNV
jgi:hypothetical protein